MYEVSLRLYSSEEIITSINFPGMTGHPLISFCSWPHIYLDIARFFPFYEI